MSKNQIFLTKENIIAAAEAASTGDITFVPEFVHETADSYGPQTNAQFKVFKKGGFSQGTTTHDMGGFDGMKIHDAMDAYTRDVRYDFVMLDPHIRFRIEEGNGKRLDEQFVTIILNAVARALA